MNNTDKESDMNVFHSMLTDGTDEGISSKRVVTLLAFALCAMAFVGDLFWNLTINPVVFEGMMWIAISGLGFTASEKFSRNKGGS
jgi:hypothetical protein